MRYLLDTNTFPGKFGAACGNLTYKQQWRIIAGKCQFNGNPSMASPTQSDARVNFRLSSELKKMIEVAASLTGQTVSDFAISILLGNARRVIQDHHKTVLTDRDRDAFMALLDQTEAKPNKALAAAARRYKKQVG